MEGAGPAAAILPAPPYWLPGPATAAVLDSAAPPERPSLGGAVTVWFEEPLGVPSVGFPGRLATIMDLGSDPDGPLRRRLTAGVERSIATPSHVSEAPAGGAGVRGVLLGHGKLDDLVGWVVEVPSADGDGWPAREVMFARRSLSVWSAVLDVVAAIVAWADWTEPERDIPVDPDRAWLRRLRYGSTRRDEQAGRLAGGPGPRRPLPSPAGLDTSSSVGTHASPVPHLRTGHFRRQAHGPRGDPWHETVWIPSNLINPPGDLHGLVAVWRLPEP